MCVCGRLTIIRVTALYTVIHRKLTISHVYTLMDNYISNPMNLETSAFHSRVNPVVQIFCELLQLNVY